MRLMTQLDRIQPANKEVLIGARIRRWECHDECLMCDPKHETNKRKMIAYLLSKPLYLPSQRNMSIITLSAPYVSGWRGGSFLGRILEVRRNVKLKPENPSSPLKISSFGKGQALFLNYYHTEL